MAKVKPHRFGARKQTAVPPAMSVLLSRVFGSESAVAKRTHMTDSQWRSTLDSLLTELFRYQQANVRTDEFHELILASSLASGQHSLASENFWPGFVEALVRYSLTLMGDYPDHRKRKPGRKTSEHYQLSLLRSVAFNQSTAQRMRTLYAAVDLGIVGTKKRMWQLMEPFYAEYGTRATQRQQLEWFRSTYPDIYARAFP